MKRSRFRISVVNLPLCHGSGNGKGLTQSSAAGLPPVSYCPSKQKRASSDHEIQTCHFAAIPCENPGENKSACPGAESGTGFQLPQSCLFYSQRTPHRTPASATKKSQPYCDQERRTGIGPAYSAWEADILPLNYRRMNIYYSKTIHLRRPHLRNPEHNVQRRTESF